jgi:uncharacterized protein (TIGR01244 family)
MTAFRPLSSTVSVAPQITLDDVHTAADQGFVSIICNRPDGEEPGQIALSAIIAACDSAGLGFYHIPVAGGMPLEAIERMGAALEESQGSVLAYCRSGTRSTHLWALAQARAGASVPELVEAASGAGYDLTALIPALQSFSR